MAMKLLPAYLILWVGFLLLGTSQSDASGPDVCQVDTHDELTTLPSVPGYEVERDAIAITMDFLCLLYPTNKLNCSWSFDKLNEDARLSVSISICDDEKLVENVRSPAVSHVGSRLVILQEYEELNVVLKINVTLHGNWTVYSYSYNKESLEVLLPPAKLSAVINGSNLLVSWALPSQVSSVNSCFEYQLDLGDQEKPRELATVLSYTEQNVDPSQTYSVRIRTRKTRLCQEHQQWSEWSLTVIVEQSLNQLNILVIVSISLGIPMILLAAVLLVRHQRVMKVLFPPIPRPPPKYKHFLEKNDTLGPVHAAPSVKPAEEEIMEVEDTEPNSGKAL
ncbi:uncharacterized protein LOC142884781 [Nelusetta ayraudi]|uniref:uncharacterized protein LOC142884781 n=1 Tax=Nelusetta ayraudi TaxID=303726 RepID=UPI003F7093BE